MLSRRAFISSVSALAIAACEPAGARSIGLHGSGIGAATCGPKLQVNLINQNYFNQYCCFLNWWKTANNIYVYRSSGGNLFDGTTAYANGYFDSDGQLPNPCNSIITAIAKVWYVPAPQAAITALGANYVGETVTITWTGTSTVTTSGGTVTASSSNSLSLTMDGTTAQTNFTISNINDPPRNIRISQTRYATNVANGEIFNPTWINQIKQYKRVRLMDWMNTNNSQLTDFSQFADLNYDFYGQFVGIPFTDFTAPVTDFPYGTKGSMHPQIICALGAVLPGVEIQVNIPFHATTACITSFANYMAANCTNKVIYEFSNEVWNGSFFQSGDAMSLGNAIWPGDGARGFKYYGYAAAQMLNIVRTAYGANTAGWAGVEATQMANSAITGYNVVGAEYYITNVLSNAVTYNQLFQIGMGAAYIGDAYLSIGEITGITAGNPTVIFYTGGEVSPTGGEGIRLWFSAGSGCSSKNGAGGTVQTVFSGSSFSVNIDTTGLTFTNDLQSYVTPSILFDMIDTSLANFISNPGTYPTKYTWFNQQLSTSQLTGTCTAGYTTGQNLAFLNSTGYPAQLSAMNANGLAFQQYEGNLNTIPDAYIDGYGGNPQFTDYMINYARSAEAASVITSSLNSWASFGTVPSIWTFDGQMSQFNAFSVVNFWPTVANGGTVDTAYPMAVAMNNFNAGC